MQTDQHGAMGAGGEWAFPARLTALWLPSPSQALTSISPAHWGIPQALPCVESASCGFLSYDPWVTVGPRWCGRQWQAFQQPVITLHPPWDWLSGLSAAVLQHPEGMFGSSA